MDGTKASELHRFAEQNGWSFTRFDYSGHGHSDGEFTDGNLSVWISQAAAVLNSLPADRHLLIGSSMGAWVSLLLALHHPEKIAGVITLAAASDFFEELIWRPMEQQQRQRLRSGELLLLPSEYDDGSPYPISYNLIEDARQYSLLQSEIGLDCPLRMIHGSDDQDIHWHTSQLIMQQVAHNDVQLTLLKNADHRLQGEACLTLIRQTVKTLVNELYPSG